MSFRVEKVASTLKSAIAVILHSKMSDPDLRTISVSRVDLSRDLKNARVYVSSFEINSAELLEKLRNASGYIRRQLSRSIYLKYMPVLDFHYDTGFEFDQKLGIPEEF